MQDVWVNYHSVTVIENKEMMKDLYYWASFTLTETDPQSINYDNLLCVHVH